MVDFFIHVADAAIGLRRALKKEKSGQKNTVFYCCRARKKRYDIVRDVFFNTRMYKYCSSMEEQLKNTWPQYERKQIQQPGTTFSNFSDKVVVLIEDTKTAVALPRCS